MEKKKTGESFSEPVLAMYNTSETNCTRRETDIDFSMDTCCTESCEAIEHAGDVCYILSTCMSHILCHKYIQYIPGTQFCYCLI
jgi:hypothetical protein